MVGSSDGTQDGIVAFRAEFPEDTADECDAEGEETTSIPLTAAVTAIASGAHASNCARQVRWQRMPLTQTLVIVATQEEWPKGPSSPGGSAMVTWDVTTGDAGRSVLRDPVDQRRERGGTGSWGPPSQECGLLVRRVRSLRRVDRDWRGQAVNPTRALRASNRKLEQLLVHAAHAAHASGLAAPILGGRDTGLGRSAGRLGGEGGVDLLDGRTPAIASVRLRSRSHHQCLKTGLAILALILINRHAVIIAPDPALEPLSGKP